ncbi:MAG: efflux RND transporter periplasmic adaptor subunit [Gammaproteobacteria bacterium]|nr:efflux RND transporter periplasmic adaptor subunit [Gammaproteobacteria bacterium]MDH4254293.1 efflux RND transporter periplasmic adaptor subunit [Gammaproteobacteria bacterium]MDH5309146.1 efflux RND transporter periplasmic adaptor subunit [Gammaproteobacteria bacterium]
MNTDTAGRVLALVSAAAILAGCQADAPDERAGRGPGGGATRVVTAVLKAEHLVDEIEALGTARANESIEIKPRLASIVTRIAFGEGDAVRRGDLLVELENSEIRANLAVAEAALSESRSSYERSLSLRPTQAISEASLEQLRAAMQVDEATVEAAKARLANTYIRAPFDGRVGLRRVSPGGYVDTSTVITTLDDTDPIKLDFSIPEAFLAVVSEGMEIIAHSLVYPDRDFRGIVDSIDTRLDPVSRSVMVRAVISNAEAVLKPGMFMTVDLQQDRGEVVLAPEEAVVPEADRQYLFLVENGVARKREVVLGRRMPGSVVVLEGAGPGAIVVSEGTQKLRDGMPVEVVNEITLQDGGTGSPSRL